jgi:hypothetical protein
LAWQNPTPWPPPPVRPHRLPPSRRRRPLPPHHHPSRFSQPVATHADHLVLVPTTLIKRWDEAAILGFFQLFSLWAARPWRIADPKAERDVLGIGAFNLLRRSAYLEIGGFESLRMEIIEDIGLGRRIKRAGLAQRIAFGRGLVSLHWASGIGGLVSVMTKNLFSAFRFYIWLA